MSHWLFFLEKCICVITCFSLVVKVSIVIEISILQLSMTSSVMWLLQQLKSILLRRSKLFEKKKWKLIPHQTPKYSVLSTRMFLPYDLTRCCTYFWTALTSAITFERKGTGLQWHTCDSLLQDLSVDGKIVTCLDFNLFNHFERLKIMLYHNYF